MDKQKQIEEMAAEINYILFNVCLINKGGRCEDCDCKDKDTKKHDCQSYLVAKILLEKYQPKIPEGAVVLTGTETEKRFEDLMVAFDDMGFMPNTTHPFPEEYVETWKQRLIFVFGQLRKEMAEEFAERLKAECERIYFGDTSYIEICDKRKIDEICKEITEGV